ncbi:hypothetical protein PSEUBRA_005320 [Kalmanozyma brasiliensis GHG001]|uniref:Uncharacterized protein n=1 Tax=Kalmanozyma brasiliensis (strain GHG001) TaxID=1365824 RepID=V5GI41_KALBG|nr:uncharacterized protein PSEUBRA_005320 [Kalmanozyma brasiliensis GHG001]EST05627.1 hypothetical protein PSEUBRA_005320 [Kalmanozyma brasiliensis GHG001]
MSLIKPTNDFILYKADFTLSLNDSDNPLHAITRMPNLLRTASHHSFFTLAVEVDRDTEQIVFSPYLMVIPGCTELVRSSLEAIEGFTSLVALQSEPGEPFSMPSNQVVAEFEQFDVNHQNRRFHLLGKVTNLSRLRGDESGWYWNFDLVDPRGCGVACYLYTDHPDHQSEGVEAPFVMEGDYALCVNVTPHGRNGVRISETSEFLVFN